MPVHVFPVESVPSSILGGDSIENVYMMVRTYLSQRSQSGDTVDRHMACGSRRDVEVAIEEFLSWSRAKPNEDPKVLWLSLHGVPPKTPADVGTSAMSAAPYASASDEFEIVEWAPAFATLRGACAPGVVILSDVCWGASPTAPARLTSKIGSNPALFFGPVRKSHRLELDTAAGIVFGALARGSVPTVDEAQRIVLHLNASFPRDAKNDKPFYRVWWWADDRNLECYPRARC